MNAPMTLEQALDGQYRSRVEATVQRLRDLADDFERHALNIRTDVDHRDGQGAYARAADRAIDTITSGLANAKPGSIVGAASAVDNHRAVTAHVTALAENAAR